MKRHLFLMMMGAATCLGGCFFPGDLRDDTRRDDVEDVDDDHVTVVDGELEVLAFEPEGCSLEKAICDVGLRMAVGYEGTFTYEAKRGPATGILDFESDNPEAIEVTSRGPVYAPGVDVRALAAGTATITARDENGVVVDRLLVEAREIDGLWWRLEDHADGVIVDGEIHIPEHEDVEVFIDITDENGVDLMTPVTWEVVGGDGMASIGTEAFHELNYQRTIMAWKSGTALVQLNIANRTMDIPVLIHE